MVDTYGRWKYVSDEPKENWCDLDRIAHWIEDQGYKPKTSMENMVVVLTLHFESHLETEDMEWPESEKLIDEVAQFVECSGVLEYFDYDP